MKTIDAKQQQMLIGGLMPNGKKHKRGPRT